MTREAKLGLLTGLFVILFIGVLLSNYLGQNPSPGGGRIASLPVGQAYRDQLTRPISVPVAPSEARGNQGVPMPPAYAFNSTGGGVPTDLSNLQPGEPTMVSPVAPVMDGTVVARAEMPNELPETFKLDPAKTVPVKMETAKPSAKPAQEYQVAAGDTLQKISMKFYRSTKPEFVQKIVSANPAVLRNASTMLIVGKKLTIPDLPQPTIAPPETPKTGTDTLVAKGPVMVHPPGSTGGEMAKGGDAKLLGAKSDASKIDTAKVDAPKAEPKKEPKKESVVYVVKSGDSLALIAARHIGSGDKVQVGKMVSKIVTANKIKDKDIGTLKIGQKLVLPPKI